MSFTYAIADLHGRFDLLTMAYDKIESRAWQQVGWDRNKPRSGTIVHLGDYVDRGPESKGIIDFLMDPATIPAGFKRVALTGNHEQIMLAGCRAKMVGWWNDNGGGATLLSYGHAPKGKIDVSVVPATHLDWMQALPLMHVDKHRVFVHAGVEPFTPLDQQDQEQLTWRIYNGDDERGHDKRHVVHGHHQFADGPRLYKGRTDLDTFAWYTGRLVVGVFDDDKAGGPVELIEVIGEPSEYAKLESATKAAA